MREAIGLMFNFEWSNATLFYGLYERTESFFQNSPMMAEGLPEGEELATLEKFRDQLPPEIFTEPAYLPPVSSAERNNDRSAIRRASALLDEAGWTVGPGGIRRNAAGETLTIEFLDDNPSFERVINPFVQNLRQIGIDASLRMVDSAQMEERQKNHDYDIIPGRLVMSMAPVGRAAHDLRHARAPRRPGSFNLSGVADPVVDGIIELIIAATVARGARRPGEGAGPGAAPEADLGAELVQGLVLDRLLGRVRPAGDAAALFARRRLLVVRPGEVRRAEGRGRVALRWRPTSSAGCC